MRNGISRGWESIGNGGFPLVGLPGWYRHRGISPMRNIRHRGISPMRDGTLIILITSILIFILAFMRWQST